MERALKARSPYPKMLSSTTLLGSNDLRCQPSQHCLASYLKMLSSATLLRSNDLRCQPFMTLLGITTQDVILYDIAQRKRLEMSNVCDTAREQRLEVSFVNSFLFEDLFRPIQNQSSLVFALFMILINMQKRVVVDT